MVNANENVVAVGPKKGECYICNANLEKAPSIQIQKQIPIIKKMGALGRACLSCAKGLLDLVASRIEQAKKGEFQA